MNLEHFTHTGNWLILADLEISGNLGTSLPKTTNTAENFGTLRIYPLFRQIGWKLG